MFSCSISIILNSLSAVYTVLWICGILAEHVLTLTSMTDNTLLPSSGDVIKKNSGVQKELYPSVICLPKPTKFVSKGALSSGHTIKPNFILKIDVFR